MQSIDQKMNFLGSSQPATSFSPRRSATFAGNGEHWDSQTSTLQSGSSSGGLSSPTLDSLPVDDGYRPSSASWLENSHPILDGRDQSVKTSFLSSTSQHPCSLSPLNELNPTSPSGSSFGPSTTLSSSSSAQVISHTRNSSIPPALEDLNSLEDSSDQDSTHESIQTCPENPVVAPLPASHPATALPLSLPTPLNEWDQTSFSLSVAFTGAIYRPQMSYPESEHDCTAPPAFFPLQRVGFSPQLKVHSRHPPQIAGFPLSLIGGMTLGVTGVVGVPVVDRKTGRQARDSRTNVKKWKTQRVVVDFVTDLSHGLETWKADAEYATQASSGVPLNQLDGQAVLPPGTYILPLSMKIPASDRLPPSFRSDHFRITYTMSLAVWSKATDSLTGQPIHCKVFTVPFDILPSTLPTGPPKLPRLVWEDRSFNGSNPWNGMWEGFKRVIGHPGANGMPPTVNRKRSIAAVTAQMHGPQATAAAIAASTATHIVIPSLPSSSFSPASQASIPVTLSIIDRPIVPTDLYIRISLIRSIYARDSKSDWLTEATEYLLPEEVLLEKHLKEETEICSRWGYVPYHLRPNANPLEECEVLIRDLSIPLLNDGEVGWAHGYSTSLELEPSEAPTIDHHPVSGSSWFAPAFRRRPPVEKEYGRHLHVSTRFSIAIEIGFARVPEHAQATGILHDTLQQVKMAVGDDFVIPAPHTFTKASQPKHTATGVSITNPFPASSSSPSAQSSGHRHHNSLPINLPSTSTSVPVPRVISSRLSGHHRSASGSMGVPPPSFPGKIRTLRCPIVIGSVAEPNLSCLLLPEADRRSNGSRMGSGEAGSPEEPESEDERRRREEAEDMRRAVEAAEPSLVGDGEAWICAPPDYDQSLKGPPAYLF
ncbi:hypothetical protein PGT21_026537 [Puccinia graminis f. sp. tritici]|uniref:Uncharacterized protein n=1 Tax=Puccinia graminis f. sp. tritici TaxID=56615 RepID=A0A5B0PCE2_PUCGR|nr:hypothetical protein PGT21_026537 [Puccinia graminis f. sp. tritici]KAA1117027.1 hypothetical protein PGTUg99_034278 [Puccinia graminis f. sp. tritici]